MKSITVDQSSKQIKDVKVSIKNNANMLHYNRKSGRCHGVSSE